MITRMPLRLLTFAFPLLVVTFGALMAATLLFQALGDPQVARVLARCGIGVAVALFVNLVLLVGVLSLRAVQEDDRCEPNDP